jgi:hypothetical protein
MIGDAGGVVKGAFGRSIFIMRCYLGPQARGANADGLGPPPKNSDIRFTRHEYVLAQKPLPPQTVVRYEPNDKTAVAADLRRCTQITTDSLHFNQGRSRPIKDPAFDLHLRAEIQKQTHLDARSLKVVYKLSFVRCGEFTRRLQFDQDIPVHNQVGLILDPLRKGPISGRSGV